MYVIMGIAIIIVSIALIVPRFVWSHNISTNVYKITELLEQLIEQTKPTKK
jgi:hypothetical protein